MKRHILILITLALVIGLQAEKLNLQQAKEQALKNNPKYQSLEASVKASKWSKNQALGNLLPTLSGSGTWLYTDPAKTVSTGTGTVTLNNDIRSMALTLNQTLFVGGKLWQAYQIGKTSQDLAELNLAAQKLTLVTDVESKYLNILQLQELYKISQTDLESSRQNLEIAALKVKNGLLSTAEYLRYQSKTSGKEVAMLQAQTALELAKQDFMNYLHLDEAFELEPLPVDNEELLSKLTAMDLNNTSSIIAAALKNGKQNNPNLAISAKTVDLSKRAYRIAEGSFLPTVVLSGSRTLSENGIDRYEFDGTNTLMLNVSIPLLPQFTNYAASRKAYYDYRKADWDALQISSGVNLAIQSAVYNLISSAKQVYSANVSKQYSEQSYAQLQERFRLNMLSPLEMTDAELMLSSAQISYVNALYSYMKAKSTLLQAMGSEDVQVLNNLFK